MTVNIYFYNMNSGLGQSTVFIFNGPYSGYRAALGSNGTSADDTVALANTSNNANNPVTNTSNVSLKGPTGRALGLGTNEESFNFQNSPCPTFFGSGCIGINILLANSNGALRATVEHEIDEVLGLGSGLRGTTTPADPRTEDLSLGHIEYS